MSAKQREAVLKGRIAKNYPLHAPPHPTKEKAYYLLTAANFEHRHIMAEPKRRTEFQWNLEDIQTGRRTVWYEFSDRKIRSEAHFYATLNYLHYNPIKHGYVRLMGEWEWSRFP